MGCIYSNFDGECALWDVDTDYEAQGCEAGFCIVEDDPNPADSCEDYQSDGNDDDFDYEEDADED